MKLENQATITRIDTPYLGLRPFQEDEKDRFFGRNQEIHILTDKILANRLTLLVAASGVGKSSLLQAGVMPELRADGMADLVYHNDWAANPSYDLKVSIIKHFVQQQRINADYQADFSQPLADFLRVHAMLGNGTLVLLLDQFEEFFYYQRFSDQRQFFVQELATALRDTEAATTFVFSMREDFAMELTAFKPYLKNIFDNIYRIEKLSLAAARLAIVEPVAAFGFAYQPELIELLLNDLGQREREGRLEELEKMTQQAPLLVEPPHLQIVCQQLWERACHAEDKRIKQADYDGLGRANGILEQYFKSKMATLSGAEQALASRAFDHLVSQHGAKMAYPLDELAKLLNKDPLALQQMLDLLQSAAILRRVQRQGKPWYELYHDIFAKSIAAWNQAYKYRQLRLRVVKRSAAFLLVGAAMFVSYDYYENYHARHFRLGKETVSERIELYQGQLNSWDLFKQRHFLYETEFERGAIEADKRFETEQIAELKNSQIVQVGELPLVDRFAGYATAGLFDNADKIFKAIQKADNNDLIAEFIPAISKVRVQQTIERLFLFKDKKRYSYDYLAIDGLKRINTANTIAKLIILLSDNSADVRKEAIKALSILKAKQAIPQIIALLKDNDAHVRYAAINALSKLKKDKAIPLLFELLKDNDVSVRRATIMALSNLKAKDIIPQVITLLKDPNADMRGLAIDTLSNFHVTQAMPQLFVLLKDTHEYKQYIAENISEDSYRPITVCQAAMEALVNLKGKEVIPQMITLLKDNEVDVRRAAINALSKLKTDKAVPQLLKLLKDNDVYVRMEAINALSQLKADKAIPQLLELLKDNDVYVRKAAINALSRLKADKAIPQLLELLKDNDVYVRMTAINALSQLKADKAIPQLFELLKDNDVYVRGATIYALSKLLKSEQLILQIMPLLKSNDRQGQEAMKNVLAGFKTEQFIFNKQIVAELTEQLINNKYFIEEGENNAALELSKTQPQLSVLIDWQQEQIADLEEAIKDASKEKTAIANDLGYVAVEKAVSLLIPMLKDADSDVITKAITSLSQIGEIHPEWLVPYSQHISKAIEKITADLDETIAIKIQAELIATAKNETQEKPVFAIIKDPKQANDLRFAALEGLENTNRPDIGDFLLQLLQDPKQDAIEMPVSHLLAKMAYQPAKAELGKRLHDLEKQKQDWREKRDAYKYKPSTDDDDLTTRDPKAPKAWQEDYKIYQYAYAIARIDPENAGIDLLKHPLYQARQAAIRAIGEKSNGALIKKLLESHQAFKPEDLPSPQPYSTYQALDKALEQVEYTGTAADLAILKQLKGTGITTQMKEQERAINERFDWTIAELDYRLKKQPDNVASEK